MQQRTINGIVLKPTEPHGYEFAIGRLDYHVRKENSLWVLDQFDSEIDDPDEAHLDSTEHATLDEAILSVQETTRPGDATH